MIEALENACKKLDAEFEGLSDEEIVQKGKDNPEWRAKIILLFAEYENAKGIQLLYDKLAESMKSLKKMLSRNAFIFWKWTTGL